MLGVCGQDELYRCLRQTKTTCHYSLSVFSANSYDTTVQTHLQMKNISCDCHSDSAAGMSSTLRKRVRKDAKCRCNSVPLGSPKSELFNFLLIAFQFI